MANSGSSTNGASSASGDIRVVIAARWNQALRESYAVALEDDDHGKFRALQHASPPSRFVIGAVTLPPEAVKGAAKRFQRCVA